MRKKKTMMYLPAETFPAVFYENKAEGQAELTWKP